MGGFGKTPRGGVYFTTVNNTSMVYIRKSTPRYCYAYKTINTIYQTHLLYKSNTTHPRSTTLSSITSFDLQYGLSGIRLKLFSTLGMKTKLHTLTILVNRTNITGRTIQFDRTTAYSFIQDGHSKKSISQKRSIPQSCDSIKNHILRF